MSLTRSSFAATTPANKSLQPEESDSQERKEIKEQVPAPISRASHIHVNSGIATAPRTFQTDAGQPTLLSVEGNFGFKLHATAQICSFGLITSLRESTADRLDADFNRDVFRQAIA